MPRRCNSSDNLKISELADVHLSDFHRSLGIVQLAVATNSHYKGFHHARNAHAEFGHAAAQADLVVGALIASEVGELIEAMRNDTQPSEHVPSITNVEEELADIIIRVLDFAEVRGYDVANAVIAKAYFNETRPLLHGGKKA